MQYQTSGLRRRICHLGSGCEDRGFETVGFFEYRSHGLDTELIFVGALIMQ